jgi:hypothetical protein
MNSVSKRFAPRVLAALAVALSFNAEMSAAVGERFERVPVHGRFVAEGVAIGDFNRDGAADIVVGPEWFEGPTFRTAHVFREVQTDSPRVYSAESRSFDPENYSDNFLTFTHDFNADGWIDILVIDWPGQDASWYENPGDGANGRWAKHLAFSSVDTESPGFVDITGDGRPEIIAATARRLGYMAWSPADPSAPWTFHPISPEGRYQRYTHGIGAGDVNADGRLDFLEAAGWWEQPSSMAGDPVWTFHPQRFGANQGGAQMHVMDVDGDGLNDVVTSMNAHGYGLTWYEQGRSADGTRTWNPHAITSLDAEERIGGVQFSQPHAVELADMDGDGLRDIVTGKRFMAHGSTGDVDAAGAPVVYVFRLTRNADGTAAYTPWLADDNTGVGTQLAVGDLDGDGRIDIAVGNKKGATVLRQRR